MFRPSVLRSGASKLNLLQKTSRIYTARLPALCTAQQNRYASHAISNPTLANIETRWEAMPPQEQADLWMALRDRMKVDWHDLTPHEKKAAYWIAFGPHGPRAEASPGENAYILRMIGYCLLASGGLFWLVRHFANPPPKTMSKEWQEATNEYLKEQKVEPITGISSAGYKGPGMVQSPPSGRNFDEEEDE